MDKPNNMDKVIEMLVRRGFAADGRTRAESFKIITQKSYPLAGAIIHKGGRLRFKKGKWWVTVGKRITAIYKKPDKPETVAGQGRMAGRRVMTFQDWETYSYPTKEVDKIRDKLYSLGV